MNTLDNLIDLVVSDAEIATGRDPNWMVAQGAAPKRSQARPVKRSAKEPRWTIDEDQYLRDHLQYDSIAAISTALGRSEYAIHVHAVRKGFGHPRHTPDYLSANVIAHILGMDNLSTACLVDLDILHGEHFPYPGRVCRRVRLGEFKRWLIHPTSWVYFKLEKINNLRLRRLVMLAQERWGDEWWNTRQAADYHHCDVKDILRYIKHGDLPAYQALGMGRVRDPGWSYWFVRRSDVEKLVIYRGKGAGRELSEWTPRADAWILRARDELHLEFVIIARLMGWSVKRVTYRYKCLKAKYIGAAECSR